MMCHQIVLWNVVDALEGTTEQTKTNCAECTALQVYHSKQGKTPGAIIKGREREKCDEAKTQSSAQIDLD